MKLTTYLADHWLALLSFAVAALAGGALLWLAGVRLVFTALLLVLFALAFAVTLLWDWLRRRRWYGRILPLLDRLDEKTLLAELVKIAPFADARLFREILRQSDKYMNDSIAAAQRTQREYREYVELWVHEIKTPIAAARLMVENDKNPTTLRIDDELAAIDRLVEQALYYARSTALDRDFAVQTVTLQQLVNAAVKAWAKPIIHSGGQLHFENLEYTVQADPKWCAFVLGQLIANALKYSRGTPQLTFAGVKDGTGIALTLQDTGIGIPPADLPRVFDKGFTGQNGRQYPKSTGIGLYLCQKLCGQMNVGLRLQSEEGQGTAATVVFPPQQDILNCLTKV